MTTIKQVGMLPLEAKEASLLLHVWLFFSAITPNQKERKLSFNIKSKMYSTWLSKNRVTQCNSPIPMTSMNNHPANQLGELNNTRFLQSWVTLNSISVSLCVLLAILWGFIGTRCLYNRVIYNSISAGPSTVQVWHTPPPTNFLGPLTSCQ